MDNPFDNILRNLEDYLPFIVFLLIIGTGVIRAIFAALSGGKKSPPQRQARPELREFLEQLRRQGEEARPGEGGGAAAEQGVEAPAAPPARRVEVEPEPAGPVGRQRVGGDPLAFPEAQRPARERALRERREPPRRREPKRPGRPRVPARRAAEPAVPVEPEFAEPLARRLEQRELSGVGKRHVRSKLTDRHYTGGVSARHIESGISASLARKFGTSRKRRTRLEREGLPGLPPGIGLREGIILSTLLGPPRVRQPYRPPATRDGAI